MKTHHRRTLAAGVAAVLGAAPLTALSVAPAFAATTDLVINEVSSDPDDWFELANPTSEDIHLDGLWFVDSDTDDPEHWVALTGVVPADGLLAIDSEVGFGKGDSVSVYDGDKDAFDAGSAQLISAVTWPDGEHAATWGLCPEPSDGYTAMTATKGAPNDCPEPGVREIRINEVFSDGIDFVELINTGEIAVDIDGWTAVDGDPEHTPVALASAETLIEPGGFYVFHPDEETEFGDEAFGLGKGDSITIALPDGTQVDTTTWPADEHATPSWGRCPDGAGDFALTRAATPGQANDCPTVPGADQIAINEVHSDADPDWVELVNTGQNAVDISGWLISDDARLSDAAHLQTIEDGTVLAGGAHLVVGYDAAGLGKGDEANFYLPDAVTLVDSTTWPADSHATSWGRCTDGTGDFRMMEPTPGAVNDCTELPVPELDENWDDIEINEISSLNDDDAGNPGIGDAVELANTGDADVSIEGWYQTDGGSAAGAARLSLDDLLVWDDSELVPSETWVIPAGGYVVFSSTSGLSGEGDAVKLYGPGADAEARQLVDEQAYGDGDGGVSDNYDSDSLAFAACPDGSDEFWRVTESSFGRDNTASCETKSRLLDTTVVVNEVTNVDGGRAELLNTGTAPVDISGWQLLDSDQNVAHTVPADTVLDAGGFYVAESVPGLESEDSIAIRAGENGSSVIAHTWYEDGIASYSRCEVFGAVTYVETPTATWGEANVCPGVSTEAWPGGADIRTIDAEDAFSDQDGNGDGDVSGATFDPRDASVLWAIMNKGRLFKMHLVDGQYVPFDEWDGGIPVRFADGTGELDAEGVTVAPDGSIYLTSERDNTNDSVSSNKVARFDVSAVAAGTTELVATDEWDVNGFITTGTNLGLEGLAYVPDAFLVNAGWQVDGTPYTADAYSTDGLFVTAVEATGALHFFSLARGAEPVEVKVEASGFPWSMDVAYDADRAAIWALCDDGCGGAYNLLTVVDGDFRVQHSYARPAGMPNLNNEGMAIAPATTCEAGEVAVIWTDDGDTDGHSLRAGTLPCADDGDVPPVVGSWATVSVGSGSVAQGGTLHVTVSELEPGTVIEAVLHSDPIVVQGLPAAGADGVIAFDISIPADFDTGAHTLVVSAAGQDPIEVAVQVLASGAAGGGDLATTGSEVPWFAMLFGAALLAASAVLIGVRRRSRS